MWNGLATQELKDWADKVSNDSKVASRVQRLEAHAEAVRLQENPVIVKEPVRNARQVETGEMLALRNQGMTYAQIGAILNCPYSSVKTRIQRWNRKFAQ